MTQNTNCEGGSRCTCERPHICLKEIAIMDLEVVTQEDLDRSKEAARLSEREHGRRSFEACRDRRLHKMYWVRRCILECQSEGEEVPWPVLDWLFNTRPPTREQFMK